ncbi:T9SS C-terminal target domain-containing protein [Aquimarina sp. BL5]|uniref:Ig-like domain-containing protein n=1 Tax=Aquimarina sp. BL5 TaxID=1714860 RepID=UPI000E4A3203|nr:Ig-like domain-containing protein [Aquimarina sp. BL5]AXT52122.1 T9SS C-terminal target domain-containing protein [Aquimarina sp. BL5]RKN10778.1 T9SS C-terminal target domain-containing protein [Aquimarina sp. BL5]
MKRKLFILNILAVLFTANLMLAQQSNVQRQSPTDKAIANVPDTGCTGQDTFDQGVRIVPNANSWKDSYQANGFCFCKSSFDHGVGNFKIDINGQGRNIKDICDELKQHPSYRDLANGDPRYNTIQCGNEPGHGDAITIQGKRIKDEKVCPGRVDQGSKGCQCKGPKFDMDWLSSRPRFGGDGNGGGNNTGPNTSFTTPSNNATFSAPATVEAIVTATDSDGVSNVRLYLNNSFIRQENVTPYTWNNNNQDNALKNLPEGSYTLKAEATDNKGAKTTKTISFTVGNGDGGGGTNDFVTILGQSINKYVSSEGGTRTMQANRNSAGTNEQFTVESAGNGTVSFKGNNGKYVSSENGGKPMNCNRNAVGSWEKFTLESLGGDLYAIKGNNGKYVSHENGNNAINCNRDAVGLWEKFIIKGLNTTRLNELVKGSTEPFSISVYPIPMSSDDINLTISLPKKVTYSSIEIIDLKGNSIAKKNTGAMESGTKSISLNEMKQSMLSSGLYIIKVRLDNTVITKKITKQ